MAILVGIDEAGYGPLLGPLVISSVVFEMPQELLRADLWKILGKAVSPHKKGLAGRLLITDSKKAYSRSGGIGSLRRTVLSCLFAMNEQCTALSTAFELIRWVCPDCMERLTNNPWYARLAEQPLGHDTADAAIAGAVLRKTMAEHAMRIRAVRSRCMEAGFYNERVERVRNKSRVLFTELCTLILEAFITDADSTDPMQVIVDRQGGRIAYQQELLRMFPDFSLSVLRQDDNMSSYEMSRAGKTMRIHFCMKADAKYLGVSLASMVSKYLREVMMEAFNAFFCGLCSGLKPTAGYWQDGQRFLKDLSNLLPQYQYDPRKIARIL
jgi:ribonuclease HII